jgi:hypothetical protein
MPSPALPENLTAQVVSQQFAGLAPLETIIRPLFLRAINERYPSLAIDLSLTQLAIPQPSGGWKLQPLIDVVYQYLCSNGPLDFSDVNDTAYYLSDAPPQRLKLPGTTAEKLDMKVIEDVIRELPATLPIALQDALIHFWNEDADNGVTRWRWLSDMLRSTLQAAALGQPALDETARQTLDQLTTTPDRAQRMARHGEHAVMAYGIETTLHNKGQSARLLPEHLLLTRVINGQAPVLLCTPSGRVEHFTSQDDFTTAWEQRISAQYQAQTITCNRYEPEGSIFDHQAAIILNQQLENLADLNLPLNQSPATLQALYREFTDPGRYFIDAPPDRLPHLRTVRALMPDPLRDALPADRSRYRQYSLALASAKQRVQGRTFLSDIDDIHTYTVRALQQALQREAARAAAPAPQATLHPDDVMLTFVVAAGYPGGAGIVEHVNMSLTELAINNLSARPSGQLSIAHRHGTMLPDWLTAEYLTGSDGLIEQVDIGKHYPLRLKHALLSDTPDAQRREVLFTDQQRVQLPLLALELSLQGAAGVTPQGASMVDALMQPESTDQHVNNHPVAIRHLAFLRAPGAPADTVSAMYLIEYQNLESGPHLLYRPLYAEPLREFANRAALFEAIAEPGALQTSVLTWLPDNVRPIYDRGGFRQPHYVRFGQGDEFAPLHTPQPATLARNGLNDELQQCLVTGQLMRYLFSDHARALVDQAERASVSNNESRWQVLMEGASLLFGSLLVPVLRGPAMLTGWLLTMFASVTRDVQALSSQNPLDREQGAIDLLLSVAMALLDFPSVQARRPPLAAAIRQRALHAPVPRRDASRWPPLPSPQHRQGTVALAGELPRDNRTALDFSFAQARQRLTPSQRMRLAAFKVATPPTLPQPVLNGPRRGLYLIENHWYAQIEGDLFRVVLDDDASVVIVDRADSKRRGPYLRTNAQGVWSVDTRLRLHGGMPPKRIAAERQRKALRISELQGDYEQMLANQQERQRTVDAAQAAMEDAEQNARFSEVQRANVRKHFDDALKTQTRDYLKILNSAQERNELNIPLPLKNTLVLLENTINNTRKHVVIAEADRRALYRAHPRFTREGAALYLAVLSEPMGYRQFLHQMLDINDRSIRGLESTDRHLEQLFNLGSSGADVFKRLTQGRPNEISALAIKDLQIRCLKRLIVKDIQHPLFIALDTIVEPLQQHVRTHSELNSLELSASDRLSVLESLVEHYGRALDSLQGLGIVDAGVLDPSYNSKLFTLLDELYQDVTRRLASEVKPPAQTSRRPPRRPVAVTGRPAKKVIRTRKKATLIGEVKPVGNVEMVEVRDEANDQLLGMYSQDGDDWVEFVEATPAQSPAAPREFGLVKGKARKLLAMVEEHLRRGDDYTKICKHPQEVEEILQYEAVRYDKLATELDRLIQAQAESARTAADQTLVTDLREAGRRLSARGKALRIQLSLELPPTHGNLEYLIGEKQVSVSRWNARFQLKGERRDFIQEYAVNDQQGNPLWFAHFHYPAANTPKAGYTAAHLKTRAQQTQSYYSLLAQAQSPQTVVDVHRGLIGKALAERWFLSLEP